MLTFRDTDKNFESKEDLITDKNYNINLANLPGKNNGRICKGKVFRWKTLGNESTRDKSSIRLLQPSAIMAWSL